MMAAVSRPPVVRLYEDEGVLDGFSGGGGASTGIEMAIGRSPDVAINHDPIALAMHEANHPETRHVQSNIRTVSYKREMRGKRCAFAWFSPDCTFFSKARGAAPFRDRARARRIRGLAWEVVRCAVEIRPRMIFMENVEEFQDWCPIGADGRPDPAKKGASFRRWVARLRNLGGNIEWRELRAHHYGAPTLRKRLFVIIRFDGLPIVWPARTHGPNALPYRTAAECIDFTIPIPSIFLDSKGAKAWGAAHGVASPKRPLALATKRRIARGVHRFVIDSPDPFILRFNSERADSHQPRGQRIGEPITTLDGSNRFALVAPILAGVGGRKGQSGETSANRPFHTITAKADTVLVTPILAPFITEHANASEQRNMAADEPLRTICAGVKGGHFALVSPLLINTRNGERPGQAPRVMDITQPFGTVTAAGSQGAIVAAFLAKHNAGHEATGQKLSAPIDTVTTRDSKAIVTSHLMKLRGGIDSHPQTSQDVREPAPTITAQGTHIAEVRAFLVKYYGSKKDGRPVNEPLDTITTKERYGLVTVTIQGEEYAIVDIGMRMLTPRELFLCQGFPPGYEIENVPSGAAFDMFGAKGAQKLTKKAQTRLVGNSVPPHVAAALIGANLRAPGTEPRA
jgi:DNA (cytosine-5)-methyltransferase 1